MAATTSTPIRYFDHLDPALGSVIAYDTINELLARSRAGPSPDPSDLERLVGMVTFGCPLNKVFYFFREPGRIRSIGDGNQQRSQSYADGPGARVAHVRPFG
jgi:hypothetical protein